MSSVLNVRATKLNDQSELNNMQAIASELKHSNKLQTAEATCFGERHVLLDLEYSHLCMIIACKVEQAL